MDQPTRKWLDAYDWDETRYEWGQTDCASLVYWFLLETRNLRLKGHGYRTLREALKSYKETGGLEEVLPKKGFTRHALSYAKEGDILICPLREAKGFPCYGIVLRGGKYLTSSPKEGVSVYSLRDAEGAAYVMRYGKEL